MQDLRLAIRSLAATPIMTCVAILSVAPGQPRPGCTSQETLRRVSSYDPLH